jgi:hyperosmotically inducible periplasmic protein
MRKRLAGGLAIAVAALCFACAESDPGITTAVKAKLAADDAVKAYRIDVDTKDRVVTLTGAVDNSAARERAVQLARGTDGVNNVIDNLTVSPAATPTTGVDDPLQNKAADAATRAGDATRDAAGRAADATRDAAGRAGDATRDAAARAGDKTDSAQRKAGDTADRVGEAATDAALTSAIKTKLLGDPNVSGLKINVDTNNAVVTLTGTVPSATEKARALELARETRGVKSVKDQLKVSR